MKVLPASSFLLLALVCLFSRYYPARSEPDVVLVRALRLVGADGVPRAELKLDGAGEPMLTMHSESGMRMTLQPTGLSFVGERGNSLYISMQGVSVPLFPSIAMHGPDSKASASFEIEPYSRSEGSAGLVVKARDASGRERLRIGPDATPFQDWRIKLWDEENKSVVLLPGIR